MKHEEEVAIAMRRREGEIWRLFGRREADILEAWKVREEQIRRRLGRQSRKG